MIELKKCPVCDSEHIFFKYKINYSSHPSPHLEDLKDVDFKYFDCRDCHALFLNPMYTMEFTEDVHKTNGNSFVWQDSYFDFVQTYGDSSYSPVAEEIKKQIRAAGIAAPSILDVGSGTGALLSELKRIGLNDLQGVEPGPQGKAGAEKYQLPIANIGITEFNPGKKYNVVLLMDVIEHIPDTHELITKIDSLLAPGGIIISNTPNLGSLASLIRKDRWSALTPPAHLLMWHKKTFAALAKRYRYTIIAQKTTRFSLLNYFIHRLPKPLSPITAALKKIDHYLHVHNTSLPLGDSLFVVMKK
jgi:2-polyprenyl-3-methyl-5-hydroxy-6-metoxy-1,4-benzoquinol methylase